MGWDAHAEGPNVEVDIKTCQLTDPVLRNAFQSVANQVKQTSGLVDGCLEMAGLDCRKAGEYMAQATGMDVFCDDGYTAEDVKRYNASAKWNEPPADPIDRGLFYSAKAFLETCAAHNLGMSFSY